jgi:phage shock protein A
MFQRFTNIIKGLLDKGLNEAETPEVLAEQAQAALEKDIKELKAALVNSVTNEKLLDQQTKKNEAELQQIEKSAAHAIEIGNDELAKQFLIKKQASKEHAESLAAQIAEQQKATAALKDRLAQVEKQLAELMRKKPTIVARAQAGDAMAKANELLSNSSGTGGMDKWEQKIREKEARSEALGELGKTSSEAALNQAMAASDVDNELAALKAKMNVESPKLVVDQSSEAAKTQVDANVPMKPTTKDPSEENIPAVVDVEVIDDDKK